MSKKLPTASADKPEKAPKPKKEKQPKKPREKKNIDFNPVASAMFEMQRKEATGNVLSGVILIAIGVITILVSVAKCKSTLGALEEGDDKTLAYAWIVFAITGLFFGVIGIYEILKSFISLEQIREWGKNASSHASPLQSLQEKRKAAEMNQSQSTQPAPTKGMAEDGSQAKKHFAFLGKKEEKKPDGGEVYNKFNPPAQQKAPAVAPPPKREPMMKQKFDYGIHEEKKQTFADKFLAENKEDPFAQYRKDLGIEEEKPEPEEEKKPQFKRSLEAQKQDDEIAAAGRPPQNSVPVEFGGASLFDQLAAQQGLSPAPKQNAASDDDDGFFMGTSKPAQPDAKQVEQMQQQVMQLQKQVDDVSSRAAEAEMLRKQAEQVEEMQKKMSILEKQVGYSAPAPEAPAYEKPVSTDDLFKQVKSTAPGPTIKPPPIPKQTASPTVRPPKIPATTVSPTIKPPPVPEKSDSPTVTAPAVPKQSPTPTVKPPAIPKEHLQPPVPNQQMQQARQQQMAQMPPMQPMQQYPLNGFGQPYRPVAYQQMAPVQNMYQPLPNINPMQGMMPNQMGYVTSPFGFAGAFVDVGETSYNPAMPPYTMHPFRPAQQMSNEQAYNPSMPPYTMHPYRIGQQQMQMQSDQAYNPSMPPYTMHPFRPSSQQEQSDQAYNPSMPPYTVHGFKPANAPLAAPQLSDDDKDSDSSYNPSMPPYTVHPFKAASAGIAAPQMGSDSSDTSYNPAMPPYTLHPFKPSSGGVTPPPIPQQSSEQSYNPAMPPYTVHAFKAADPDQQPLQPQLTDTEKENAESSVFAGLNFSFTPEMISQQPVAAPVQQQIPQSPTPPVQQPLHLQHFEQPQPKEAEAPAQEPSQEPAEETKTTHPHNPLNTIRGLKTQKGEGDKPVKKPPITQRLGEYRFSLFEDLGSGKAPHGASQKKETTEKETETTGGSEMAPNFNGGAKPAPERKKSFSEKFLNRQGKKATSTADGSSEIVKNGTAAQKKFVDASEFDSWTCPGCGSVNQEYVGVCSCGERKPRNSW